jgi:serine/threonine-protein kinase
MGEVWVAEHDMLARPAALKLVRPELLYRRGLSAELQARFEREAQSIATLSSPHTVNLYDFGVTHDGVFYYVMELLDGLDLDTLVRRHGPLEPARAVHFLLHACASLAEAHARGLVHRDIKPSNLIVCRQGLEHDFVKVLDFGIVRARAERHTGDGRHATIEGTPGYLAPEAATGAAPDPRADLYALGCVGYWLLTGHGVFEGGDDREIIERHRSADPVPPSRRTAAIVPGALDALILACLQKSPAARPTDAAALAVRLRDVPLEPWNPDRAAAWWGARERMPA